MIKNTNSSQVARAKTSENTRQLKYVLDRKKAIEKKIQACSREHITLLPCDAHNCHVEFSTSFFEMARNTMLQSFHTVLDVPKKTRHLTYDTDAEETKLAITDVIKVSKWQIVKNLHHLSSLVLAK